MSRQPRRRESNSCRRESDASALVSVQIKQTNCCLQSLQYLAAEAVWHLTVHRFKDPIISGKINLKPNNLKQSLPPTQINV